MAAQSQLIGFTQTNTLEVEAGTKAARVTLRPEDYGALGSYSLSGASGIMAASLAANSPVYSFRWGDATRFALLKRVTISLGCDTVAFAAGSIILNMFIARSFSVADTGGASILPTGSGNKLRTTGMGTTLASDIRMSATATLTAGTRTKDGQACASLVTGAPAVAGQQLLIPTAIWDQRPGEHPLFLAQNEGFVIEATVPITGTWKFGVKTDWLEVTAY